jgi:hypothetical protein
MTGGPFLLPGAGTAAGGDGFYFASTAGRARRNDMADERDQDRSTDNDTDRQQTAGQQSHRSEYGAQAGEQQSGAASGSGSADRGGGMAGQPIGGNDSNTGSGTTLTAGYTPPSARPGHASPSAGDGQALSSDGTGVLAADDHGGMHTRPAGNADGAGTTSNMGGSSTDRDPTSGASSGVSGGEGFIGSQASGSDRQVEPKGNFDMGDLGRGAEDQEGNESDSGSSGSFTSGGSEGGNSEEDF